MTNLPSTHECDACNWLGPIESAAWSECGTPLCPKCRRMLHSMSSTRWLIREQRKTKKLCSAIKDIEQMAHNGEDHTDIAKACSDALAI